MLIDDQADDIISFSNLLENLMQCNKDTKGASVLVPETILFSAEKVKCYVYFDKKAKEVKGIYNKIDLDLKHLMKIMAVEYRKRKHTISTLKFTKDKEEIKTTLPMVNVKYNNKRVDLEQGKFTELMLKHPNSKIWKDIQYIQNCIVIGDMVGQVLKYSYTAPIDIKNPSNKIKYLKKEETIEIDIDYKADSLCNYIAYYLSKNLGIVSSIYKYRKYYTCKYSSLRITERIYGYVMQKI